MPPSDSHDPLLRQVITDRAETLPAPGFIKDPLGEADANALPGVTQLKRLRIHTRLPAVIPARLTGALAERLHKSSLNIAIVIYCNHPAELDASLVQQLHQWRNRGIGSNEKR